MQLSDIRRLTPITQEYAYFQSSGFSPKMEPVIEETNRWAHFQNAGGAAPGIHEKMLDGFEATRDKVAKSMNADSDEIVLGEKYDDRDQHRRQWRRLAGRGQCNPERQGASGQPHHLV